MRNNKINNTSYTPWLNNEHNQKFLEMHTPESFLKKITKTRSDIHPDFLTQFDEYIKKVYNLLSENISVVTSRIVQEAVYEENNRVENALSKTWKNAEKLSQIFPKTVLEYTNNRTYAWTKFPQDLSDAA